METGKALNSQNLFQMIKFLYCALTSEIYPKWCP